MSSTALAKKKGIFHIFDFAMKLVWITKDSYHGYGNYVLIHFMDHSGIFGVDYLSCRNITEMNEIKSKILNNGFKIDWKEFNSAMEHLNDPTTN